MVFGTDRLGAFSSTWLVCRGAAPTCTGAYEMTLTGGININIQLHRCFWWRMLIFWRLDGGGWGMGWDKNVLFDFCSIGSVLAHQHIRHVTLLDVLALPHIRHATLLDVLLRFHKYVVPRCWMFSCTSTHTSCYAAGCSL